MDRNDVDQMEYTFKNVAYEEVNHELILYRHFLRLIFISSLSIIYGTAK